MSIMRIKKISDFSRSIILLVSLVALLFASPIVETFEVNSNIINFLWAVTLVICAFSASSHIIDWIFASILSVLWVVAAFTPDLVQPAFIHFLAAAFCGFIVRVTLKKILNTECIEKETLADALSVYIFFGLMWASLYAGIYELNADSFFIPVELGEQYSIVHFVYFSFVSLTTLGLGDILPVSPIARMLVAAEATTGVLYIAVLMARLVSLYSTSKDR